MDDSCNVQGFRSRVCDAQTAGLSLSPWEKSLQHESICKGTKYPHAPELSSKAKKKSPIFQMNILYSGLLKQCLKVSNFLCIKAIVLDKENYRTQNGILYTPFLSILKEIKKVWLIFKNVTVGSVLTTWVLVALNHDTM